MTRTILGPEPCLAEASYASLARMNAFIDGHHGSTLAPEFQLLRFAPEPWSGAWT